MAAARKEMMEMMDMMEMWMWPKSGKTPALGSESGPQKSNCRATVCGIGPRGTGIDFTDIGTFHQYLGTARLTLVVIPET